MDLFYRKHTLHLILHITIFMNTCTYVFSFYTITVQLNLILQHSAVKLDPATLRTHRVVALAFCSEGRRIWGSKLSENIVT